MADVLELEIEKRVICRGHLTGDCECKYDGRNPDCPRYELVVARFFRVYDNSKIEE